MVLVEKNPLVFKIMECGRNMSKTNADCTHNVQNSSDVKETSSDNPSKQLILKSTADVTMRLLAHLYLWNTEHTSNNTETAADANMSAMCLGVSYCLIRECARSGSGILKLQIIWHSLV